MSDAGRLCSTGQAVAIVLMAICLTSCQSAAQRRYSWSYDDMVSQCKPWMSVEVDIENHTELHNISFTLSTSSVINNNVYVHTSRRDFTATNRAPCLYHGINVNTGDSVFASEIRGLLKMTFKYNGTWYRSRKLMNSSEPAIARHFELDEGGLDRCHYKVPPSDLNELKLNDSRHRVKSSDPTGRKKRSLMLQSFQGAAPKKVLELVIVVDRSFVNKEGGEGNAVTRVMQITNYVNGVYHALGLRVVLTSIVIWSTDPISVTGDSDYTLSRFTEYKAMQIDIKHDTVVMLSAVAWEGGRTLGVAWMNRLCHRITSCGLISDRYPEAISTAWTMAHEIGHNLGFKHVQDVSGCRCSKGDGCIMNAFLSASYRLEVLDWSTCSVDAWKSQADAIWRSCLADAPDTSYYSSRSPMCGNGILETGEQCDCGPAETCSSKCCDAATCRLKSGAVCASGPCCDWNTCSLRPTGDECRSAVGVCDVPETCSGTSEWCPSDDKVADGVECSAGQAYCYSGECRPTDAQCKSLFSAGATTADSVCYERLNIRGDLYGHCDKKLQRVVGTSTGFDPTYSFAACSTANAKCGQLYCYQETRPSNGFMVTIGSSITCYGQPYIDSSSAHQRSLSMVSNGAKCDMSSMCINSTCTALSSVTACPGCPNCNGNGVLTKAKVCFCNAGFAPPNCSKTGCGGSVTSPYSCSVPTESRGPTTLPPRTSRSAGATTVRSVIIPVTKGCGIKSQLSAQSIWGVACCWILAVRWLMR